jgi:peptidoglycan/xylan/chitin deacetylase (PgdA/CDA1 family)
MRIVWRCSLDQVESSMRVIAIAVLAAVTTSVAAVTAHACDNSRALGTSRVLKVDTNTTAGFGKPFKGLPLSSREIVLTFDDGPAPGSTPRILDILARECVRATFFMIGKRAEAEPRLVARAKENGHTIGSHSYSHRNLDTLPPDQAVADIQRGYEAVEKAAYGPGEGDRRARLFRFPSYKSTPELVSFVRAHKGTVASWDISSEDWRGEAAEVTMQRVRRLLVRRDRGVLSLHDNQKNTVEVLPMIIDEIRARGMRIVHLVAE